MRSAAKRFGDYIRSETLAVEIVWGPLPGVEPIEIKLDGKSLALYVKVVTA